MLSLRLSVSFFAVKYRKSSDSSARMLDTHVHTSGQSSVARPSSMTKLKKLYRTLRTFNSSRSQTYFMMASW